MMDGVTILNTYMDWTKGAMAFLTLSGICIGMVIVFGVIAAIEDQTFKAYILFGLAVFGAFLAFLVFTNTPRKEFIQATVDPSVSWTELTEHYEIVKTESRIVTMIERRQDDEAD